MGQVTIYLDNETEQKMLSMIKKSGISKSRWIAEIIKKKTTDTWPEHIVQLAGAWRILNWRTGTYNGYPGKRKNQTEVR